MAVGGFSRIVAVERVQTGDQGSPVGVGQAQVVDEAGEVKDAGRYASRLDIPLAIIDKRRHGDDEDARAYNLIGEGLQEATDPRLRGAGK